jgi:lysozyme
VAIVTWQDGAAAVVSAQLLDVSNYQGQFSWKSAKAGYPALAGGIFKATEGTGFIDADAQWNATQVLAVGLHRGMYHFLHPGLSGVTQARYFVAELQKIGLRQTDMLFCDNETAGTSPAQVAGCAAAFMNELRALCPHNPMGVYSYVNFIKEGNCNGLGKWPLWLAFPALTAPVPPPPWMNWKFWQWGTRNGIDADAYNGTAAEFTAWIDSFAPQPPPPGSGPYRHVTDGARSLAQIAQDRGTTPAHLIEVSAKGYTAADIVDLAGARLPAGIPFYTTNP